MAGSAVALSDNICLYLCLFLQLWCSGIRGLGSDLGELELYGFTVFYHVDAMI